MSSTELRLRLLKAGYAPIPINGKVPAMDAWQTKVNPGADEVAFWATVYPSAASTGILTKFTPAIDIDLDDPEAAAAVEELARERFEERGYLLVRIGRAPRRAILLRTDAPFPKITGNLISPNGGTGEKLELLADGQQLVCFGRHVTTGKDYAWHGGEPGEIPCEDLPYVTEAEARQFVDDALELLEREFGYRPAERRPKANRAPAQTEILAADNAAADWSYLVANIVAGTELHDNLRDLAAKLVRSGMAAGATVNFLYGLMDRSSAPHDDRWAERRADIPRLVDGALELCQRQDKPMPAAPTALKQVLATFDKWLDIADHTPILAVLGTIAANRLPGDPVWLGIIAPPSSAKTEILNATARLPDVVAAATLTPASLLSGTAKKQQANGTKGGLLRQIGDFGILALKDFGSILSIRPDAQAEILACLRELYDGAWVRHLGVDGGRTLAWKGKLGLIFCATEAYDAYHAVVGNLGDRFLLSRLRSTSDHKMALKHTGGATKAMREELAEAVAGLFVNELSEPPPLTDAESDRLGKAVRLAVRLRGGVERHRYSREIEMVYGAEGPGRLVLSLERLLAGLSVIGADRGTALAVVESVALDSTPPIRRRAFELLLEHPQTTRFLADQLGLPTSTTRRALEELVAHGLATRSRKRNEDGSEPEGGPDRWQRAADYRGV